MSKLGPGAACCLVVLFIAASAIPRATIKSEAIGISLRPSVTKELQPVVTSGLSSPVYVTNAHDGSNRLFIVELGGIIKVLQPGASSPTLFLNMTTSVLAGGERGLLGLAFHPLYTTNRRFFVYFTRIGDGAIQVSEFKVSMANPNVADTLETPIITIPHPTNSNHNGGTVQFGPDGFLYLGPGDGGSGNDPPNNAQNINQLLGKVLRIDIDTPNGSIPYSSPPSNPFFGPTAGADEIYMVGMRNPYRFSFDRGTGQLWIGDVGQGSIEEIDIGQLGGNYGWRTYEGGTCTNLNPSQCIPANFVFPVAEYSHAGGRCSVTGGYAYRGSLSTFAPGAYIYGDYCSGEILMLEGTTQSLILDTAVNISSFGEDEAGEIYVVGIGGTLHRIINPPTAAEMTVGGRITTETGTGLGRVWVTLLDTFTNETRIEQTRGDGTYVFMGVPVGRFYIINAVKKRYTFTPHSHAFTLVSELKSVNFTATRE